MVETYESSGVDIAAGEEAVQRIKEHVRSTFRPEAIGEIGGFGDADEESAPSLWATGGG